MQFFHARSYERLDAEDETASNVDDRRRKLPATIIIIIMKNRTQGTLHHIAYNGLFSYSFTASF